MKRLPTMMRVGGALVLCLTLLFTTWRLVHPPPRGYLEIVVSCDENAKGIVTTNLSTRKAPREKIALFVTSCAFEQTLRFPLRTTVVHSLAWAWRAEPEAVGKQPRMRLMRLLDEDETMVWESASMHSQWKFSQPLELSRASIWPDHAPWLTGIMFAAGLVLAAWLACTARRSLATIHLRPVSFIAAIVLGFGGAASVYYLLIALQREGPLLSEIWIHDLAMEKHVIADAVPSPRTLVVGGSSGLYGVDTAWLSEEGGQSVVNLAMHAGMPLKAHFELWDGMFRPGDTVLLHLEYNYWLEQRISRWMVDQMLGWMGRVDRPLWGDPPPWDLVTEVPPQRLLIGLMAFAHLEAFAVPTPARVNVQGWGPDWHLSPLRARLNGHGDLLENGLPKRGTVKLTPYVQSDFVEAGNGALDELRGFIRAMKARKVAVCFAWPATIRSELSDFAQPTSGGQWTLGALRWIERSGALAAGVPAETQLSIENFHDTYYHLTPAGREIHSATLLRQLKALGWPRVLSPKHEG